MPATHRAWPQNEIVEPDDFNDVPFYQRSGLGKAPQLFGNDLNRILDELNLLLVV